MGKILILQNMYVSFIESLEKKLFYKFNNRKLLEIALTHSSYASEHGKSYEFNNERLEFLGDAFLDAIVGKKVFVIMQEANEGVLSKTRADVVCEKSLADVAQTLDLGDYLRLGKGEENGGGRQKPSIVGDAVEALIGAMIIDGGYERAERIVLDLFSDKIRLAIKGELHKDHKTKLQEKLQEHIKGVHIEYRLIREDGPDHRKEFVTAVFVNGEEHGRGIGKSKKESEQAAAYNALTKGDI